MAQEQTVRHKLDLRRAVTASAFVMMLLLAVLGLFALFSIWSINRTWIEGMDRFTELRRLSTDALEAQVSFKVQVQEWKNILLRGDDPQLLDKHHAAFTRQSTATEALLASVAQQAEALGFDDDARQAARLVTAHEALTQAYETTLKTMQGAAPTLDAATAHAIDVKLRGADRALESGIGALAAEIGAASDAKREALIKSMSDRYGVLHGFIISVIIGALAVMGFVVFRLLRATRT
jgi:hypothetical protein